MTAWNATDADVRKYAETVAEALAEKGHHYAVTQAQAGKYMSSFVLTGTDNPDAILYVNHKDDHHRRFSISGGYPRGIATYPAAVTVSINVGDQRGPEAMASEIARRVLPAYLEELERVCRARTREEENYTARCKVVEALEAAAPTYLQRGTHTARDNGAEFYVGTYSGPNPAHAEGRISYSGEEVTLTLTHLTPAEAHDILALLDLASERR